MVQQFIRGNAKDLFSVYHEPKILDHCDTGVLFCYPYGQEYIRCHRLYVNLANKLSSEGFHALRFDYFGTGDSDGDFSAVTLKRSLDDINFVLEEYKQSCELSRVILFGVRIGATLSLLSSKTLSIDGIVLWNPILNGASYLKDIDISYEKWLSGSFTKAKPTNKWSMENFGFEYSRALINELNTLSLRTNDMPSKIPTLVFLDDTSDIMRPPNLLVEKSVTREYWSKAEDEIDKAMVPVYETNKTMDWFRSVGGI